MSYINHKEREFELFFNKFSNFIHYHVLKYNLSRYGLDPEDIVQEIRVKLWKLIVSEKKIINYPSYIKKIVSSSVIDQVRRIRREQSILDCEKKKYLAENELQYKYNISKIINLEQIVEKAVDSLQESRRQVVKLYLLNFNINEISSYLNWTKAKTRNLLYRGLADLKKILKKSDITI